MNNKINKQDWERLPEWIKVKVEKLGVDDKDQWIHRQIPALGGKSIVKLSHSLYGRFLIRRYFNKVISRFGGR